MIRVETPLPKLSARQILAVIAICVILAGLVVDRAVTWWNQRQEIAEAVQPYQELAKASEDIHRAGAGEDEQRDNDDHIAEAAANNFKKSITEAKRNDSEVNNRSDRAVPHSVRDAFRAQRIAIERSGSAGADSDQAATE